MVHSIAAFLNPVLTGLGLPGRRLADRVRFVAGMAIAGGGAAMSLPDLIALAGRFG
jgi:hypothetical protein